MPRPRVFDVDEAVRAATDLFWRKGYEETSLADLTAAMGIKPPSFYYAFESKEGLFQRVLEAYRLRLAPLDAALDEATARQVAERMLLRMAEMYTDPAHPPGCLMVNCALPCAGGVSSVREDLAGRREARRMRLRARFERARREGDLPKEARPDDLARFVLSVGWGMAIEAQSGATRTELRRVAMNALGCFPHTSD